MTTVSHNFLGIPVDGDITKPDRRTPQRPLAEFEPLIGAVLDDPYIAKLGWTQYTPYFNDGDPCVFGVGEVWFRTVDDVKAGGGDDEDEDEDEDEDYDDEADYGFALDYSPHPTLGHREYRYVGTHPNRQKIPVSYTGQHEASYDRCAALSEAIGSGAFDDVLLEAFGDHAKVTVAASGIVVDGYSHD